MRPPVRLSARMLDTDYSVDIVGMKGEVCSRTGSESSRGRRQEDRSTSPFCSDE